MSNSVERFVTKLADHWGIEPGRPIEAPFGSVQIDSLGNVCRLVTRSVVREETFTWQVQMPSSSPPEAVDHVGTVFLRQAKGWLLDRDKLIEKVQSHLPGRSPRTIPADDVPRTRWETSQVRLISPRVRIDVKPFGYIEAFFCPPRSEPYLTSHLGCDVHYGDLTEKLEGPHCIRRGVDRLT